ncbi:MAG: protein-disulfide reductase DsbD family protein, partial [Cyclobacteriaceae bacterium]|nr:protein-disulfide reductase DsbD family protein [Cyclobacteriaceae bacterium]
MLKKTFTLLSFLIIFSSSFSQILDPVKWSWELNQVEGSTYEIVWTADMEPGWSVYSQYLESEDGPIATSITFEKGTHFELIGLPVEDSLHKEEGFDPIFEMNLAKYHDQMVIRQKVKILDSEKSIKGMLSFMTCDDEKCLPPKDVDFSINING